jgi:hypothetical protein
LTGRLGTEELPASGFVTFEGEHRLLAHFTSLKVQAKEVCEKRVVLWITAMPINLPDEQLITELRKGCRDNLVIKTGHG